MSGQAADRGFRAVAVVVALLMLLGVCQPASAQRGGERPRNVATGLSEAENGTGAEMVPNLVVVPGSIVVAAEVPHSVGFTVTWTVKNEGMAAATGTWTDRIAYSIDAVYASGTDPTLLNVTRPASAANLAPGESYTQSATVSFGTNRPPAQVNFVVLCDADNTLAEGTAGELDNTRFDDAATTVLFPDLYVEPMDIDAPATARDGGFVTINWKLTNRGDAPAVLVPSFPGQVETYVQINISYDTVIGNDLALTGGILFLPASSGVINPGGSVPLSFSFSLPSYSAEFPVYVVLLSNSNNNAPRRVYEGPTGEANNASIDIQPIMLTRVDLTVPDARVVGPASAMQGQTVTVSWSTENTGGADTYTNWYEAVELSTDRIWGNGNDTTLTSVFITTALGAGQTVDRSAPVTIPAGTVPGDYFFLVRANVGGPATGSPFGERTLNNNTGASVTPVTVLMARADLVPQMVVQGGSNVGSGTLGAPITVNWRDANTGLAAATGSWTNRVVLSSDTTFGNADDIFVVDAAATGPIAVGANVPRTVTAAVPAQTPVGTYRILVANDVGNTLAESNETNNSAASAATIAIDGPDLVAAACCGGVPAQGTAGGSLALSWFVRNVGGRNVEGFPWQSRVVLSVNSIAGDADDIAVATAGGANLSPASHVTSGATLAIPATARGVYNVIVTADWQGTLPETNESNNSLVYGQITIDASDLVVGETGISVPTTALAGQSVSVQYVSRNIGPRGTIANWTERVVLSVDEVAGNADDVAMVDIAVTSPLAAGAQAARSGSLTVPAGAGGAYFVLASVDVANTVPETNETNNTRTLAGLTVGVSDLVVEQTSGVQPSSSSPGQQVFVQWNDRNIGPRAAAGSWSDRLVLSVNSVFGDGDDVFVRDVAAAGPLASGDTLPRSAVLTVPNVAAGAYVLLAGADFGGQLAEVNEANNAGVIGALEIGAPDLVISQFSAASTGVQGTTLGAQWTIRNSGNAAALAAWTDRVFVSSDATLDAGDAAFAEAVRSADVAAGGSYDVSVQGTLPAQAGAYWLLLKTDTGGAVGEGTTGELNNVGVFGPISVTPTPNPDLAVGGVSVPGSVEAGSGFNVVYSVSNAGALPAGSNWKDAIYLSADATLDSGDLLLRLSPANEAPLAAGASYSFTRNVTLPLTFAGAQAFVIVRTDTDGAIAEQDEANNVAASGAIEVRPATGPDLVASAVNGPSAAVFGASVSLSWQVGNQGTAAAAGPWSDVVYLSSNATLETTDRVLASRPFGSGLAVGASGPAGLTFDLPLDLSTLAGPHYLLVRADGFGGVNELDETNNVAALGPIEISLPELPNVRVAGVSAAAVAEVGATFTVNYQLRNDGPRPASGSWLSEVRLVPNGAGTAVVVSQVPFSGTLGAGETSGVLSATFAMPDVGDVGFRAAVRTNSDGGLVESPVSDNEGQSGLIAYNRPDLKAMAVTGPASATADSSITVQYSTTNEGTAQAMPYWIDAVYLSADQSFGNDVLLGTRGELSPLSIGGGVMRTFSATVPGTLEGEYWIIVEVDRGDRVIEGGSGQANNVVVSSEPVVVGQPPRPNLVVASVTAPAPGLSGTPMEVSWTVRNVGAGAANGFWRDRVFVSSDATLDDSDVALNEFASPMALMNGESYTLTRTLSYPSAPGAYFVIVRTDALGTLNEGVSGGEGDNVGVSASPLNVATFVASATAGIESAPAGTPVSVSGVAMIEGTAQPAANVPVVVRVGTSGFERRLTDMADAAGNFEVTFEPGPTEGGLYGVAAGPAHEATVPTSDQFSLWALIAQPLERGLTANPGVLAERTFTLRNPGNQAQTGLVATVEGVPAGVEVEAIVNPGGAASVGPNAGVPVAVRVLASQTVVGLNDVIVRLTSAQGGEASHVVVLRVLPAEPALALVQEGLIGGRVSVNVTRGERMYAQFQVENVGSAPTGPLGVSLPELSWLSLATRGSLPSLAAGERASVVLQLDPPSGTPIALFSGTVSVGNEAVFQSVPFRFNVVSTGTGDLRVRVTDEFTYYAEGEPLVPGATIRLRTAGEPELVATAVTDQTGTELFEGLTEGYYDIEVVEPKHGTFRSTIFVGGGDVTEVEAFMPRELVNYRWTVMPMDFEDIYTLSINATFETQVPAPVVVIEPGYVDLTGVELPTQINYTITNHGLVTADDVVFIPGTAAGVEVVPLVDRFGDLPGMSSVTVPVLILPSGSGRGSSAECEYIISFAGHELQCGGETFEYFVPTYTATGECEISLIDDEDVPPVVCGPRDAFFDIPSSPNDGSPSTNNRRVFLNVPSIDAPTGCAQCVTRCSISLLGCVPGVPGLGCVSGVAGCGVTFSGTSLGSTVASVYSCWGSVINCIVESAPLVDQLVCVCSLIRDCVNCTNDGPDALSAMVPCSLGDFLGAAGSYFQMNIPGGRAAGVSPARSGNAALDDYERLQYASVFRINTLVEILGSVEWLENPGYSPELAAFNSAFALASGEGSSSGVRLSESERVTLLASARPPQIDAAEVEAFIARWNRSMDYFDLGILSPEQVPSGWDEDFIDVEMIRGMYEFTSQAEADAKADGFGSLEEAALYARQVAVAEVTESGSGVCAKVSIQIDQTVAVTRTAFSATLELENESSTPLEGVNVVLRITDENGQDATGRFGVFPPLLAGGLTAVNGTGTLPGNTTGSSSWTILPTNEAAPLQPTVYSVSGTLSYVSEGQTATIPLFPVRITVLPDPSLQFKYFLETVVYADDPFTAQLEPSVPFDLGLLVKNNGAGIAEDLTITSSQPEIVENDRDLLIDFDIIGTQVGSQPISPSLTVNLGDIGPQETNTARWQLISSLQGEFTRFSASYEHVTGQGDPRLSLIESVDIFGLSHVVRDLRPGSDLLPDFLTNDFPDPRDLPDTVHLSSGIVEEVNTEVDGIAAVLPGELRAVVDADVVAGWNYIRVPDPLGGSYRLASVERSDGTPLLAPDNAWQTSRIDRRSPGSPVERFVHIFDRGGNGQYTLAFDPDSAPPAALSVHSVQTHGSGVGEVGLALAPGQLFSEPRGQGVAKLVYTFNEPINPATFNPINVQVDGFTLAMQNVDLSGVTKLVSLTAGNTVGVVEFTPPLPSRARYCVQLIGVADAAGNTLAGAAQRLDIAALPGDASGDARVNPTDVGGVGSLISAVAIDRDAVFQVRSDMDLDGVVTQADVQIAQANRRTEAASLTSPCLALAPNEGPGGQQPADGLPTGAVIGTGAGISAFTEALSEGGASGASSHEAASSRTLAYEFNGEQRLLAFVDDMIAVQDPSRSGRDVAALLDQLGVPATGVSAWPTNAKTGAWWSARLPTNLANEPGRRELGRLLATFGLRGSPVLRSEDGSLLTPGSSLLVRFKDGVPAEWAASVIERTAGAGLAVETEFAGVRGLVRLDVPMLDGETVLTLAAAFTDRRDVAFAEPDMVFVTRHDGQTSTEVKIADASSGAGARAAELVWIGDQSSEERAAVVSELAAGLTGGRAAAFAGIEALASDEVVTAGSTAGLAGALADATETGAVVVVIEADVPYGSGAVGATMEAAESAGVRVIVRSRSGELRRMPTVVDAGSERAGASRAAAFALALAVCDEEQRRVLRSSHADDAALRLVEGEAAVIEGDAEVSSDPRGVMNGDVNGDGATDFSDVLAVLAELGAEPNGSRRGDVNGDGIVDLLDVSESIKALGTQVLRSPSTGVVP